MGAAGIPRRRRRGHPRVPRGPEAQALGILARDPGGRPAGRAGEQAGGALSARDVRLAASGSGRRRPAQTPPEAGAWAGGEGGAARPVPQEPSALAGEGGRADAHAGRAHGEAHFPSAPVPGSAISSPSRSHRVVQNPHRLAGASEGATQPLWARVISSRNRGNKAPTCQGHWEGRTSQCVGDAFKTLKHRENN